SAANQTTLPRHAPTANAQRASGPCVLATDPSSTTVSRYTCGFSQVSARAVATTGASRLKRGFVSVAVAPGAIGGPSPPTSTFSAVPLGHNARLAAITP